MLIFNLDRKRRLLQRAAVGVLIRGTLAGGSQEPYRQAADRYNVFKSLTNTMLGLFLSYTPFTHAFKSRIDCARALNYAQAKVSYAQAWVCRIGNPWANPVLRHAAPRESRSADDIRQATTCHRAPLRMSMPQSQPVIKTPRYVGEAAYKRFKP